LEGGGLLAGFLGRIDGQTASGGLGEAVGQGGNGFHDLGFGVRGFRRRL